MRSHCRILCLDDDRIERADSQRWDDSSSSMDNDVHEVLRERKNNVHPCLYSGSEDAEEMGVAFY